MAKLPRSLQNVALFFERLPGIGVKTANRLAMYLLRIPEKDLRVIGEQISQLKSRTKMCRNCMNLTEEDMCEVCNDPMRDKGTITVVETALDVLSFETGNIYKGVYHVLHGKIDPLNSIGPDDIFIHQLEKRVLQHYSSGSVIKEVILATNPDMEGEATAMYIRNQLKDVQKKNALTFQITRLGYGLPIGAHVEYADYGTLSKSIENRKEF